MGSPCVSWGILNSVRNILRKGAREWQRGGTWMCKDGTENGASEVAPEAQGIQDKWGDFSLELCKECGLAALLSEPEPRTAWGWVLAGYSHQVCVSCHSRMKRLVQKLSTQTQARAEPAWGGLILGLLSQAHWKTELSLDRDSLCLVVWWQRDVQDSRSSLTATDLWLIKQGGNFWGDSSPQCPVTPWPSLLWPRLLCGWISSSSSTKLKKKKKPSGWMQ